jgi:hypothetical protein
MSAGFIGAARARRRREEGGREGDIEWLWRLGGGGC